MSSGNSRDGCFVWIGPAVMMAWAANFARFHGTRWEFGQYGMPRTLLAPDGVHHPDGTAASPVILPLVRAGIEEEVELVAVFGLIVSGVVMLRMLATRRKLLAKLAYYRQMTADLTQKSPARPSQM